MTKITCPKCHNDTFKISISEKQDVYDDSSAKQRMKIVTILNITCASCGWNKHFQREK